MTDWRKDSKARRRLWRTWYNMKRRCENSSDKNFHRYGGRGITVCEEWRDFDAFMDWAYESGYDPYAKFMACTLDRIDNNGNYCSENCRWISLKQQTKNTSLNHFLTYKGITHSIVEWVELLHAKATTVYKRYELGMPPEKVLYPGTLNGVCKDKDFLESAVDAVIAKATEEIA